MKLNKNDCIHITFYRCVSMTSCEVCCENYTAAVRRPVPCSSCAYTACTRCVKSFLTSTPADPHCMNCRHVWNREFLDTHLTRSWIDGDYKRHRESVLFDREKSRLPATQEAVEVERERRKLIDSRVELRKRRLEIKRELAEIEGRLGEIEYYEEHGNWRPSTADGAANQKKEARQFVAACPSATCRGFLNTAYTCGVCEGKFCPACREPKIDGTEHVCDPGLVATSKAIVADSRACPSCGTAISRVSGCDQMYCTQCDTAFSYTTGKVVEGVIHNPHYFERLAKLKKEGGGGGTDTGPGACDRNGWPDWYRRVHASQAARFLNSKGYERNLQGLYRIGVHIQVVVLPSYPTHTTAPNNSDLRIRYLLGEIDERRLRQLLQQRDRARQRDLEVREPLELAVVTILEFFIWLTQQKIGTDDIDGKAAIESRVWKLYKFLETHVNAPLRDIAERYGNAAPALLNISDIPKYEVFGYKPTGKARPRVTATSPSPSEQEGSVIEHH